MNPTHPIASPENLAALEFPALRLLLAGLAATDLGRERLAALTPFSSREPLELRRRRIEEASRLVADGALVPATGERLGELLARAGGAQPPLGGLEVLELAALLRAAVTAAARILAADPPCPFLAELASALPDARPLLARIDRVLDRRGGVRDDASERLVALRREIRRTREGLYGELTRYVAEHRPELSEETIPLRAGRLVLVLQAGAKGRLPGLVYGRSASGKSFYFEPLGMVEENNQLQQAVEDESAERERLLAELVGELISELPLLERHGEFLGELDLLQAAVRFAEASSGRIPELAEDQSLRLVGGRHPLLDPRLAALRQETLGASGHLDAIVALDLELSEERRALVVTGPNAGGKTVALKTVGLLAVLAQCGFPVPAAAGTSFPLLARVVATVGDEQDLLADRSTFSGRLLRLREAWEACGPSSLILLDELGSGTDPEEGAALAVTLLEALVERGGLALVTTHLLPLAAAALDLPGAGCAAMEFAPATGRPTYRLLPGPPGGSEALALARRLGLPALWLDRAEARLGGEQRELRRLLTEVERVRQELANALAGAEREGAEVLRARERLERERAALEAERRVVAGRLRSELESFRRATAQRLEGEVERLRSEIQAGRRKGLASAAVGRLFAEPPAFEEPEAERLQPLVVGAAVRHRTQGWQGTLQKLDGERAEVAVSGKRLHCRSAELAPSAAEPPPRPAPPTAPEVHGEVSAELQLIGERVEPALDRLDAYLDQALLAGRQEVRIVHGHGSGRLREAVRSHLRGHPAVAAQRPGEPKEGGNGATVATLSRG